jgi:hypothetical protein
VKKPHRLVPWLLVTLFACIAAIALLASPARAADLTVTNIKDSGAGSLRNAIKTTNTNGQSDTIMFRVPDNSTITLTSGQLTIANEAGVSPDLTIKGPGARKLAVSGNDSSRVFRIDRGAKVGMVGLAIKKGFTKRSGDSASGSGDGFGGGIDNLGTLEFTNSTISENRASGPQCYVIGCAGGGVGGGISNGGALTITNSTIYNNSVPNGIGGGGIFNDGTLQLNNSTISKNSAPGGGGIRNDGTLQLNESTISKNNASNFGGGVENFGTTTLTSRKQRRHLQPIRYANVHQQHHLREFRRWHLLPHCGSKRHCSKSLTEDHHKELHHLRQQCHHARRYLQL